MYVFTVRMVYVSLSHHCLLPINNVNARAQVVFFHPHALQGEDPQNFRIILRRDGMDITEIRGRNILFKNHHAIPRELGEFQLMGGSLPDYSRPLNQTAKVLSDGSDNPIWYQINSIRKTVISVAVEKRDLNQVKRT